MPGEASSGAGYEVAAAAPVCKCKLGQADRRQQGWWPAGSCLVPGSSRTGPTAFRPFFPCLPKPAAGKFFCGG